MDTNLISMIGMVVLAGGLVTYSLWPRKTGEQDTVRRRLAGRRGADEMAEIREQARRSATERIVKRATPMLTKIIMPASDQEQTNLRAKLATAGMRQPYAQTIFLASKSIVAVVFLLLGGLVAWLMGTQLTMVVGAAAFGGGLGMMLPSMWLSAAARSRQQKIRNGLPDCLDLLVVSVEAGLGLDAALKRVGEEMEPVHTEVSEEMRIATMETQMGLPRSEALGNMARRTGLDEVRSLVSVIAQAEKFGTSVAQALRNQAESLRTKRRQKAEEAAQKTAVKLLVPLILFIFPAIFAVLGGPAVINTLRALKDNPTLGK